MDKVKTAEETLSKITGEEGLYITHGMVRGSEALEAMEAYATQQSRIDAIGFAKWVTGTINPIYICNGNGTWEVIKPSPTPQPKEFISDEALYELYLLSINKK